MNRKQAGIILTLLALIICTGILASRVNEQFKDGMGLNDLTTITNENSTQDYFYETRNIRERNDSQAIDSFEAIIADENTSKDQKADAQEQLTKKTMARDFETRIELSIKSKGFEDSLCFIEGNKAKVVVKSDDTLTDEQCVEIQDVVMNVAKIYEITIESK